MTPPSQSKGSSSIKVDQAMENALKSIKRNSTAEAIEQLLAILKIRNDHPEANYHLGLLTLNNNQPSESLHYFETALDKRPDHGPYWVAYIDALEQSGQSAIARETLLLAQQGGLEGDDIDAFSIRFGRNEKTPDQKTVDQLILLYQQKRLTECENLALATLEKFPDNGFLWKLLGAILNQRGHLEDAIFAMQQATKLLPHDHEAFNNLGVTQKATGALTESEVSLRQALLINTNFAEAYNNLGVTLLAQGKLTEGEICFRKAVQIQPGYIEAYCNLGTILKDLGNYKEAEHFLRHALELNPSHADGYNNLGNLLMGMNRLAEAEKVLRKAIQLKPDFAKAYFNLGNVHQNQGNLQAAEQCYLDALKRNPSYSDAFDGLLFVSNYHSDKSSEEIFSLYQEYNKQFGIPYHKQWQPHKNTHNSDRRLKIGYVSPAFSNHPVFNFFKPLLSNHNKKKFEIYAYAEIMREDEASLYCKQHVDHWIPTTGISDEELAEHIRADEIDILIDLAGHTAQNRLAVFARKPAPVSLHWLDFGYTTGLSAVDYYLTDLATGPMGSEHLFSEQLWRLPVPPFTYHPSDGMGKVNPLPAIHRGYITFGTLTRGIRLNKHVITAWVEILKRVKNSRLIIDSNSFKDPAMQDILKNKFTSHGIDPARLSIGYHSPPWDTLRDIDIGLDCFPHNSGTTLFENLYMGIPFITYAHRPGVGTIGSSILSGINRHEWIAHSTQEYIEKTVILASDISSLTSIRSDLREEIQKSPLMDEQGFTTAIENAYLAMFKKWTQTAESSITADAAALYNLGIDHQIFGRVDEAQNTYIQAINIQPDFVNAYNNLGVVFQQKKQFDDAEKCFALALTYQPDSVDARLNLANTYKLKPDLFKAEENYRKVIELQPDKTDAHYNLGNILQEQGRLEEATVSLLRALEQNPEHLNAFSTLLFTLNYHPDKTPEEIFEKYKKYNEKFCMVFQDDWISHRNNRSPDRCLKVGYIAPSYNKHPARYFIEPLLAHQNKKSFQTFAYIDIPKEEAKDDLFYPYVDRWISSKKMTDQELSDTIRNDEIDILIDLAGHTFGNRLLVFARRPAPVSLHWLDFGYTTGLTAIDFYLTDTISVPPGNQDFFSETLYNIETPALAYRPPVTTGKVNSLPARENKYITFGTLTRAIRINYKTIRVWAEILKQNSNSRLVINSGSFNDPAMQQMMTSKFAEHGIDKDRLDIGCQSPPWDVLRRIDIMLDCFPHNSGTTLIEGLYMGVPYITLADRPSMGRLGSSILEGIGHPEWIAATENDYIQLATTLSSDLNTLSNIRENLRQDMENSPLMDEQGFAVKVETAYKKMFAKWCKQKPRKHKKRKSDSSKKPPLSKIKKLIRLFDSGDHNKAIKLAKSLTTQYPNHGTPWKILGPLLFQKGLRDKAIHAMEQATLLLPNDSDTYYNLGIAQQQSGLLAEAESSYLAAIQLNKNHIQAYFNLASIQKEQNRFSEAIKSYQNILKLKSDSFEAHCNLGNIFKAQEKDRAAINCYQTSLKINPNSAEPLSNLSLIYKEQGLLDQAENMCLKALKIQPDLHEAHNNLGLIYQEKGRLTEADTCYRHALALKKDYSIARCNLGLSLQQQGKLTESEHLYNQALIDDPENSKLLQNLGLTHIKMGRLTTAEKNLCKSIELRPDYIQTYSNLLFLLNNHPDKKPEEIYHQYEIVNKRFFAPLEKEWEPFCNDHNINRKLKIAYVGYNFRKHSMYHFLEPLLEQHNKKNFEVFIYTDLQNEDEITARYKTHADHWIQCTELTDSELAKRIRTDNIDILIDLAGHTERNRLGVFARKPAPVSLHWLDFGYTTGLTAIDYYLTDTINVPAGSDHLFSEVPYRMEGPCIVYRPTEKMEAVNSLPALENNYITFGTLTRTLRINHKTIRVWIEILQRVPHSHLVIDSMDFKDPQMQEDMISRFTSHGIERTRLEIGYHSPPWDIYRSLDIGLDCFPHNSGTTLVETLYMGSPFITLADRPSVGCLGSSILHSIGHPEWIANTEDEYIEHAVSLASDLSKLSVLRKSLRQEMRNSPLMDEKAFAQKVEAAYRDMFQRWAGRKDSRETPTPAELVEKGLQQALYCQQSNLLSEAKELYQSILSIDPDNSEAHFNLGQLLLEQHDALSALPYLEKAVNKQPEHGLYWLGYIDAMDQSGQHDAACELLTMALNAGLEGEETEILKNRLLKEGGKH
ncbi:MAG TPA: tetratricopeptide repeat protein [Desulfocapsa sulfexigens]|nr:tetratricopeptide repeat protein [Desulfocapsa sulfexigens]